MAIYGVGVQTPIEPGKLHEYPVLVQALSQQTFCTQDPDSQVEDEVQAVPIGAQVSSIEPLQLSSILFPQISGLGKTSPVQAP